MTEYDKVVHVETLTEYCVVLKRWFKKGYDWYYNATVKYAIHADYFTKHNARYLVLEGSRISHSTGEAIDTTKAMSFKEFLAKERGQVTYEVSEEQMAFLHKARENQYPATYLVWSDKEYKGLFSGYEYTEEFERDLLKYVAGDENVVFKVKEPLYLLKGKDSDGDTVYFRLNVLGTPTCVYEKSDALKAPHDEIVRWKNSFWKVEPVDA